MSSFDAESELICHTWLLEFLAVPPLPSSFNWTVHPIDQQKTVTAIISCHSVSSIQYQSYTPGYITARLSQMHKINHAMTNTKDSVTLQNALKGTTVDSYNLLVAGNLSQTL
jgi:hypothetical protein